MHAHLPRGQDAAFELQLEVVRARLSKAPSNAREDEEGAPQA